MSGRNNDDQVGYGTPPRSGQFKPGQSGNPAGRNRRKPPPEPKLPSYRPTQKLTRAEAERLIAVRDGNGTRKIPTTEAVMRALAQSALKGGILAQRTYLNMQHAEDARLAAEQEEVFNFWEDYVMKVREAFELAEADGHPEPELFPHPADVLLDYDNREVRIIGPRNREAAEHCLILRARLELFYELMVFFEEAKHGLPTDESPVYGVFSLMFTGTVPLLPPRLRGIDEALSQTIFLRATGPHRSWITYLNQQLKAVGLEGDVTKMQYRSIDLRQLDLRPGPEGFEYYRWPKRRAPE